MEPKNIKTNGRSPLAVGLQWLLGGAFFLAGWLKWMHVSDFETAIQSFHLSPRVLVPWVAAWLPAMEMSCGSLLLSRIWIRPALLGCVGMSALFVGVLSWGFIQGNPQSCGCFGAWDPVSNHPVLSLIRATLFLIIASFLYLRHSAQPQKFRGSSNP